MPIQPGIGIYGTVHSTTLVDHDGQRRNRLLPVLLRQRRGPGSRTATVVRRIASDIPQSTMTAPGWNEDARTTGSTTAGRAVSNPARPTVRQQGLWLRMRRKLLIRVVGP